VAHGADHEIFRAARGPFDVVRLSGKVNAAAFTDLRTKVLAGARYIAVDAVALDDPGFPLARELALTARKIRNVGGHLVVLNARGRFRDLLRAVAPDEAIPLIPSERLLDGEARTFNKRLNDARLMLSRIRTEVEHNPLWQMVDRDGCWLCPYCGALQEHIRFNPRQLVPDAKIDTIYLHVVEQCEAHRNQRPLRSMNDLSDVLKGINQEKLAASRSNATALASKVAELQDRARVADELETSIRVATHRQRNLLPSRPPEIPGVTIAIGYFPARKISGDFYDFIDLGDGRFGLLIGDVAGHGIEAGIVMGVAKKVIQIRARDTGDPALALQLANRDLFPDLDRTSFVTAYLAFLDPRTHGLCSVRAGHNPAILYSPDREPAFSRIEPAGLVMGLDSGPRFNRDLVKDDRTLHAGDTLLLYTDGLPEAKNPEGEEFGLARLEAFLRSRPGDDPDVLLQTLALELERFSQGVAQEDDITMICARVL
jgi:serine phosphatase RsbU (regulator of sigma subunit)